MTGEMEGETGCGCSSVWRKWEQSKLMGYFAGYLSRGWDYQNTFSECKSFLLAAGVA